MRRLLLVPALALIAAQAPAPPSPPKTPTDAIAASKADEWTAIPADELMVMDLGPAKRVIVQLAPEFAPVHVANIQKLAKAGYWQGAKIYRVQDNYVAQWGNNESEKPLPAGVVAAPPAEYHRALAGLKVTPLGSPDAYAPAAGFAHGWAVAYDPQAGTANLTHCYGSVGVGRGLTDTGMGGELYAAIGHAPRHLDRNIAVVGRVISGIENLASLARGHGAASARERQSQRILKQTTDFREKLGAGRTVDRPMIGGQRDRHHPPGHHLGSAHDWLRLDAAHAETAHTHAHHA